MRLFVPLCFVLLLSTAGARAEEGPAAVAARKAELGAAVTRLGEHLTSSPPGMLGDVIDPEALFEAIEKGGFVTRVPVAARDRFRKSVIGGLGATLRAQSLDTLFGEVREFQMVRRDVAADARHATVVVRFLQDGERRARAVLSYVHREGAWRLFDLHDVDMGLPISVMAGVFLSAMTEGAGADAARIVEALQAGTDAVAEGDTAGARGLLEPLDERDLPGPIRASLDMLMVHVELDEAQPETALKRLDRLQRTAPEAAIIDFFRAWALNDLGRSEEALHHARRYAERIDADAQVNIEMARALMGLDRTDEALAHLGMALDDAPGELNALAYLARLLPAEREAELAARLAHLRRPATEFEQLAEELLDADEFDALERVTRAVAPRIPDHRDVPYYEGLVLAHRGQHREAAVKLEESVRRLTPDVSTDLAFYYVDAWLDAMLASGQGVEAVLRAPDPAAVFDRVMEHLNESGDLEARRRLVQEAATLPGLGRRLRYERADLLHTDRQFEAAVAILEPLRRELMDEAGELEDIEVLLIFDVVDRLVRDLMHLDRAEQALEVARAHEVHTKSAHYLAYVHALRGETDKAIHYLRLEQERGNYPQELFEDPDVATLLATEPYRDVRKELLDNE